MHKLLMWLVTLLCPDIIFLMSGKVFSMIVAFALQLSILGWIPAMIWARNSWKENIIAKTKTPTAPPPPSQEPPTEQKLPLQKKLEQKPGAPS